MPDPKPDSPGAAGEPATPPAAKPRGDRPAAGSEPSGKAASGAPTFAPTPAVGWIAGVRETTTTVIAGAVVLVALLMLWRTFEAAEGVEQMKDVMLFGLSILGSVIGFYFGRVPAERRAEAAEANRDQAQETARSAQETASTAQHQVAEKTRDHDEAQKKLNMAKTGIEKAKSQLSAAAGRPAGQRGGLLGEEGAGKAPGTAAPMEAYLELDALSRML